MTYYLDDQIKEYEMGEACGTHVRKEKCTRGFGAQICRNRQLEDIGVDWMIMFKLNLSRMAKRGLDLSGSGQEQVAGFCEHANELPVFIKFGEFLD